MALSTGKTEAWKRCCSKSCIKKRSPAPSPPQKKKRSPCEVGAVITPIPQMQKRTPAQVVQVETRQRVCRDALSLAAFPVRGTVACAATMVPG